MRRISAWFNKLKSGRQRDLAVGELKVILGVAVDYELLSGVPKFPKLKKARMKSPDTFYTFEQQDLVISCVKNQTYRDMITLLAHYMMRPCEVRALRQNDVDVFQKNLRIDEHFSQGNRLLDGRKSNVETHLLRLNDEHIDMLRGYLTGDGEAPLFKGHQGGFVSEKALQEAWRDAARESGLPYIDLYTGTKSSTATELLRRGVPEEMIKSTTGHETLTALRRYAQKTQMDKLKDQDKVLEMRRVK